MKRIYLNIVMIGLLAAACSRSVKPDRQLQSQPDIFPDYADVTIPCNIAPMNFQLNGADSIETQLIVSGGETTFQVEGENGNFDIPMKKWRQLLDNQKGGDITFTVCYQEGNECCILPVSFLLQSNLPLKPQPFFLAYP